MEKILGYSALEAGVGMLPMLGRVRGRRLPLRPAHRPRRDAPGDPRRHRPARGRPVAALLLRRRLRATGALVPGLLATGLGAGLFYPTVTTAAVGMLDESQSSLAGGIAYMFQVAGGAIGLGLCTTLFTIRSEDEIVSDAARGRVCG